MTNSNGELFVAGENFGVKDRAPWGLIFILLFYSGTVVAPHAIIPKLSILHLQVVWAILAIVLFFLGVAKDAASFRVDKTQKFYIFYCLIAIAGLTKTANTGLLEYGYDDVSNILKHLVLLVLLVYFSCSKFNIIMAFKFMLITITAFIIHSIKAIASGYSGLGGRFDNYVGMISNADNIGIFCAIMAICFLQLAILSKSNKWYCINLLLGLMSLVIMIKTQTRSAIIVSIILWLYWLFASKNVAGELRKKTIICLLFVVCLFAVGVTSKSDQGLYFNRIKTISNFKSEDADFNTKSRLFMWEQGIKIGIENLVLGAGSGALSKHLVLEFDGTKLQDRKSKREGFSIHNTFIQIFAERGGISLCLFLLVLLSSYKNFTFVEESIFAQNGDRDSDKELLPYIKISKLYLIGYVVGAQFITIDYDWTLFAIVALSSSLKLYIEIKLNHNSDPLAV